MLVACSVVAFLFDRRLPFFASLHSSFARSLAGMIEEDEPHRPRREREEVPPVVRRDALWLLGSKIIAQTEVDSCVIELPTVIVGHFMTFVSLPGQFRDDPG